MQFNNLTDIQKYVLDVTDDAEKYLKKTFDNNFSLSVRTFDSNPARKTHRGGKYAKGYGYSLSNALFLKYLSAINEYSGARFFHEYASFDHDKYIGGVFFDETCKELPIKSITLHEIAHSFQFFTYDRDKIRCKPHGPVFKKYYKALREEFLNNDTSINQADIANNLIKWFKDSKLNVPVSITKRAASLRSG